MITICVEQSDPLEHIELGPINTKREVCIFCWYNL
jgi:hypothetical protein